MPHRGRPPPTARTTTPTGRRCRSCRPGENGLVNATDAVAFETNGQRPAGSQDQLAKYADLLYGAPSLTERRPGAVLRRRVLRRPAGQVTRTETPGPGVTIYRDTHDVPHVYGDSDQSMAFGAGFAQAEDRLFLMDVLRHYGAGTLASFLGAVVRVRADGPRPAAARAVHAGPGAGPGRRPAPASTAPTARSPRAMIDAVRRRRERLHRRRQADPRYLPADYAAAAPDAAVPQPWTDADVVAIAGLIGGIFGKGGGTEVANAHLLTYLQGTLGATAGLRRLSRPVQDHRTTRWRRPSATASFPYEAPGTVDPSPTAIPDRDRSPAARRRPRPVRHRLRAADRARTADDPAADGATSSPALQAMPAAHEQRAGGRRASTRWPATRSAVFGPQVSYFAPQILIELDLHSPDYDARAPRSPAPASSNSAAGRTSPGRRPRPAAT